MQNKEAEFYLGKKVRLVLANNFNYTGEILQVNEDTLILLDKFEKNVSIQLKAIVTLEEI